MSHALATPTRGPHTVDDLFELPDDGKRYEVLGGQLIVSPSADMQHQTASHKIANLLEAVLPWTVWMFQNLAVSLPDGDGPIPDLVVATAPEDVTIVPEDKCAPAELVHTVVEIVSPSNASTDRWQKREMYAAAGIPCYWRLERRRWRGYRGPVPVLVVGMLRDGEWDEVQYPAGTEADIPVVVGRGLEDVLILKFDPASLITRHRPRLPRS